MFSPTDFLKIIPGYCIKDWEVYGIRKVTIYIKTLQSETDNILVKFEGKSTAKEWVEGTTLFTSLDAIKELLSKELDSKMTGYNIQIREIETKKEKETLKYLSVFNQIVKYEEESLLTSR